MVFDTLRLETITPLKVGKNPCVRKLAYTGGGKYETKDGVLIKRRVRGVSIPHAWLYELLGDYKKNTNLCLRFVKDPQGKPVILVYPK